MIKNTVAHIFAILGVLVFSPIFPLFSYLSLIEETDDLGGPLNLLLIPCSNLLSGLVVALIMVFVFRKIKANKNLGWASILFAIAFIVVATLNQSAFSPIGPITQTDRFLALGGSGLLIAAPTYWFVYELVVSFPIDG